MSAMGQALLRPLTGFTIVANLSVDKDPVSYRPESGRRIFKRFP